MHIFSAGKTLKRIFLLSCSTCVEAHLSTVLVTPKQVERKLCELFGGGIHMAVSLLVER